ncbi:MAG: ATP synthase F1 subunit gamma [Muribaculaceae bacterium]|nr:ATP synthase F1 subunit gamma [Muribaculaceae bacterium]
MATLRELKGRIGSVASTEKTTSAMKMISSAKMHKATGQLQRLKPYRGIVRNVLSHLLVTDVEFSSPLIEEREVKRMALVVYGSDDGLCGAFNINIFKKLLEAIEDLRKQYGKNLDITVIPIGKKMSKAVHKIEAKNLKVEDVAFMNTRSTVEQLTDFTELLRSRFVDHVYDRVDVAYMQYVSSSRQLMHREQLLPLSAEALAQDVDPKAAASPCIFEPDANSIFNSVLPLHLRATMQEIFVSSTASEQASRVMAMQTASDNAAELLEELNLEYNKLRQQSITTELLNILGGQVER